uniref:UPF0236 family transposase-like protein n=2 Tax=Eggerthella lenta TaxID=84112 RepID=UPI00189B117E
MEDCTLRAVDSMAELFYALLRSSDDFEGFEADAMDACMGVCASAMAAALERLDALFLGARRPAGARVHDVRERALLCECGQVAFRRRRFELADGTRFFALDEALGLRAGTRVSPGAFSLVRDDALCCAYARAAELLCRHTRTKLSRRTVGSILRQAAEALKRADSEAARDLFELGLAADAAAEAEVLCVEADGTWPALQRDPQDRAEVKAAVAYAGKEELPGGRRRRIGPVVHYAAVSGPEAFWKRAAARVGASYDLAALETVHLGTDGEGWCKGGAAYFPESAEVVGHLDPRHLSRAIAKGASGDAGFDPEEVWLLCAEGRVAEAIEEIGSDPGADGRAAELRGYLANNAHLIGVPGPSLGTIEGDNATVYKKRLGGQRSWSREGLAAMACLLSARASGMALPGRAPAKETPRRRRIAAAMGSGAVVPHKKTLPKLFSLTCIK